MNWVFDTSGCRELKQELRRAMLRRVEVTKPARSWVGAHCWNRQQSTGSLGYVFLLNIQTLSRPVFEPEPLGWLLLVTIPVLSVGYGGFFGLIAWLHRRGLELGVHPEDVAASRRERVQ